MWKMRVYFMTLFLSFLLLHSLGVVFRLIFLYSKCFCSKQSFCSQSQQNSSALTDLQTSYMGWYSLQTCRKPSDAPGQLFFDFLCCYHVQTSALTHNLAEIACSCDYICNFSSPQRPFLSEDGMNVFLHSATLKTHFQGMRPLWTWQECAWH